PDADVPARRAPRPPRSATSSSSNARKMATPMSTRPIIPEAAASQAGTPVTWVSARPQAAIAMEVSAAVSSRTTVGQRGITRLAEVGPQRPPPEAAAQRAQRDAERDGLEHERRGEHAVGHGEPLMRAGMTELADGLPQRERAPEREQHHRHHEGPEVDVAAV